MTNEKSTSKPAVQTPSSAGVPEAMDSNATDAGPTPQVPKTAGSFQPSTAPLDNTVANRNAGRPRQASTTPRPTDKPLG
jgi:hypothetical protein